MKLSYPKKLSRYACVVLSTALLLAGCKGKDGDPGPAGPSGTGLSGNITGFVNSVDENGVQLSKTGVLVTLDGVTPAITATSDADGRFTLSNVRAGTYNIVYSRAGYGTFRRIGVGHVGGDQATFLGTSTMSQVSTQTITSLTNGSSNMITVYLNLTVASPVPTNTFRVAFFASASPNPTPATGILISTSTIGSGGTFATYYSTTVGINRFSLTNAGFASGTTVYLAAFGATSVFPSYLDPATGRAVYPTFSTTSSPGIAVQL
ncbi:carboxypeptidase regulatory-like domain-containing protein [Hymenobacter sp. BT664]|uniref:Carboxypeptidase regulatory-like domain-containing protein n=1 Tax=Hymenobacter montanus TaxID=2771359 RepID=A0A927BEX5_9BACT|nr:carboxypeptidase-like regulatory domain-containing protein [Hymenobacter montanus]MBD2768782.1 carboxypeptidase regulatory-like domain-containing protein [Hymenobacter montanus]